MHLKEQERRENLSSRKDRNPYPRLTPPWLQNMSVYESRISRTGENIVPSSFSSSLVSSAAASPPAAPPAAGAAAAPPPDPTFNRRSLTSFPSRACKLNRQHLLPTPPWSPQQRPHHLRHHQQLGQQRLHHRIRRSTGGP